jgi:hypothetical protein
MRGFVAHPACPVSGTKVLASDWLEIGSTAADGGPLPRPQVGESDRRADWVRLGSLTGEAYRQAPQTAVVPAAPDY